MKRIIIILLLSFSLFSLYATKWTSVPQVDKFGDETGDVIIASEYIEINYGSYSWQKGQCAIIIAKYNGQIIPGFSLADTSYEEWRIYVKLDDGSTFNITGNGTGCFVFNSSNADKLIEAMKKGCKIVIEPTNKYANYSFNFGRITITDDDLAKIKESGN